MHVRVPTGSTHPSPKIREAIRARPILLAVEVFGARCITPA